MEKEGRPNVIFVVTALNTELCQVELGDDTWMRGDVLLATIISLLHEKDILPNLNPTSVELRMLNVDFLIKETHHIYSRATVRLCSTKGNNGTYITAPVYEPITIWCKNVILATIEMKDDKIPINDAKDYCLLSPKDDYFFTHMGNEEQHAFLYSGKSYKVQLKQAPKGEFILPQAFIGYNRYYLDVINDYMENTSSKQLQLAVENTQLKEENARLKKRVNFLAQMSQDLLGELVE